MNLKYILIVLVLAAIIGGGIWFYKEKQVCLDCFGPPVSVGPETKDEIAKWKTYGNKEYGFEIKYPNSWYAYEDKITMGLAVISTFSQTSYEKYFGTFENKKIGRNYGVINLVYSKDITPEKQIEGIDRLIKALGRGPVSKIEESTVEEININGTNGYKVYFRGKGYILDEDFINIFYIISDRKSGGIIKLEGTFAGEDKEIYEKYSETFKQMFSTFRFLE